MKQPNREPFFGDLPPMSYSDSWPEMVTRRELKRELHRHGLTLGDWDAEHDEVKEYYESRVVLGWLGY